MMNGNVYYELNLAFKEEKVWKSSKRYSEFESFHGILNKICPRIPFLPPKSLFKLSNAECERRRTDLEKYMKVLKQNPLYVVNIFI